MTYPYRKIELWILPSMFSKLKCSFLDEESYRSLIPLIKDEESALKEIVTLFVGEDEVKEKSFEEMQEFV